MVIEVKSGKSDDTKVFELFKELYADRITAAFIVGTGGLPLKVFFSMDLKTLFRKNR